jgi:tRNA nucleotidyltransferase (CCA-adding enzyme)
MHMPGAEADGAIVTPAATLAWQRLAPQHWPVPPQDFPPGTALVGGAVRDALLNRLPLAPDLDVVLPGDAVAACRDLRRQHGGSAVVLDAERSIARLVLNGWTIDLARQDGDSLQGDLQRRDYTINAMALPLLAPDRLVDPLGGLAHLSRGELVAVAEANLLDDPLRLLRGLRLACELNFQLEPRTKTWIQAHREALATVAGERVLAELEKMAAAPAGGEGLAQVLQSGLLSPWLTGKAQGAAATEPESDLALLQTLSQASAEILGLTAAEAETALPLARLAALLDGPALQRLRSSRRLQQRVERLRYWRRQLGPADTAAQAAAALPEPQRFQLHRQLEDDLSALLLGWTQPGAQSWLKRWRRHDDPLFHPRPAIDGNTLQRALQVQPSPQLGQLLDHLMLEQAFGRLNGAEACLQCARTWLKSHQSEATGARRCD